MDSRLRNYLMGIFVMTAIFEACGVEAWTGEIRGRVVCDVCADSSIGPEDHVLEGAEVAVLCITKLSQTQLVSTKLQRQCRRVNGGTLALQDPSRASTRLATAYIRPIVESNSVITALPVTFMP